MKRWAITQDRAGATRSARAAFEGRFERLVDPDGALGDAERAKRAAAERRAYFTRLGYLSGRARRR